MLALFYVASVVAVIATVSTIVQTNAVHALLNLVVSLLAVAVVFYAMGAPFVAALEVIIYAGAIMVLFIFIVMMLNLGERAAIMERSWWKPGMWIGPAILSAVLLAEIAYAVNGSAPSAVVAGTVEPKQVGIALYGPYLLGVELASLLLLAGMVGAYRIAFKRPAKREDQNATDTDERRADARGDFIHAGAGRLDRAP